MMTDHRHPLVAGYLDALATEVRRLPSDQARELMADIAEHLDAGVGDAANEAEVRNALDRLGTPRELVDAAAPTSAPGNEPARPGWIEAGAVIGLLVAELLFVILPVSLVAWIAGLVLLAVSKVWTAPQKVLGFVGLGTGFVAAWLTGLAS
ncbi:MAG: HAAS signaling domain-containing protein, partial [Nocardioides sp.]